MGSRVKNGSSDCGSGHGSGNAIAIVIRWLVFVVVVIFFFAGIVPLLFWAGMGVALVYHLDSVKLSNLTPEGDHQ